MSTVCADDKCSGVGSAVFACYSDAVSAGVDIYNFFVWEEFLLGRRGETVVESFHEIMPTYDAGKGSLAIQVDQLLVSHILCSSRV